MNEIVLETPRLILRRWRLNDVDEAAKIYAKPEVMDGNIPGGTWTRRANRPHRRTDARAG